MKQKVIFGLVCCLMTCATAVLADSYIMNPNTNNRLYKWDGKYLMNPNTGKRLYKWDGTYILKPNTGKRLFKYDGTYIMNPNTGKRLTEIKGNISIAILIAFSTGLL